MRRSASARARPCIVSTVREPGPPILSFIRYHRQIGFDHIYLFFDDPKDRWLERVRDIDGVTAIACDERLLATQRELPVFEAAAAHLGEITSRQSLNMGTAVALARENGNDWILHIDSDELFYCEDGDAERHFATLPGDVGGAIYSNLEAAPEQAEFDDYFREVTLFKKHPGEVARTRLRRHYDYERRRWYFLAYENGKSAARVSPDLLAELGPHLWGFDGAFPTVHLYERDPVILHYPNCGYGNFRRKYQQLGRIPDTYNGTAPLLPFHRESRDAFHDDDESRFPELYRRIVLFDDKEEVERLLAARILVRISAPAAALAK